MNPGKEALDAVLDAEVLLRSLSWTDTANHLLSAHKQLKAEHEALEQIAEAAYANHELAGDIASQALSGSKS